MDSKKQNNNNAKNPQNFQKKLKQLDRRSRYIIYERDKGKGKRKFEKFDERYTKKDDTVFIEDLITARNMHIALDKALADLTEEEYQIISECFFEGKKPNYTKLGKKYGITRQAYTKRRKNILKKLKKLVISYYEEF
ncbi:MAG: hypothetical protein IJ192_13385 [Clostridia bacterium]|nr:hypothetical protein [Clostridia bacterium]